MDEEKKKKRIARLRARLAELEYTPRSDWNSAFEALLRIDMHKYGSHVSIKAEHRLGEEPPRIDYLLVKGGSGVDLGKGIFRIFRGHNIIEYKNPGDALNGRVIRKVCGYANFYIGVAEHESDVRSDDVTVSVFRAVKPVKLFRELETGGKAVTNAGKGIYYIGGITDLPLQVVVTSELEGAEYAAYRALSKKPCREDARQVIKESGGQTDPAMKGHFRVLIEMIAKQDKEMVQKIKKEDPAMADTLMEIMKDEIDARCREERQEGHKEGHEEGQMDTRVLDIRNLMKNANWTEQQAMDNLDISLDQRAMYTKLVNKQ